MSDPYEKARELIGGNAPGERITGPLLICALTDALRRAQKRGDGHAETLHGITTMNPDTEGDRMRQWARDGLSGYVETTESTVKIQQDRIEQLEGALEATAECTEQLQESHNAWRSTSVAAAKDVIRLLDGMELAWGLIANAWDVAAEVNGWEDAAETWRNEHWNRAASQLSEFKPETPDTECVLDKQEQK